MSVVNLDDYRPKTEASIKADIVMKATKDYSRRLRDQGYPENAIFYMVKGFMWKLAKEIKATQLKR